MTARHRHRVTMAQAKAKTDRQDLVPIQTRAPREFRWRIKELAVLNQIAEGEVIRDALRRYFRGDYTLQQVDPKWVKAFERAWADPKMRPWLEAALAGHLEEKTD